MHESPAANCGDFRTADVDFPATATGASLQHDEDAAVFSAVASALTFAEQLYGARFST